ncbi:hypothetical protein LJR225_004355 [Phenylobacterium sp. LjRoot225]|uniref:hypothetical protein n=1 Tax=Phenylobacterium sp. LjRoot225 TaxID=3342285 RepID=UPI003ECF05BB
MSVKIQFPDPIDVPRTLPLYEVVPPAWTADKVARLAARFDIGARAVDVGAWYVARNDQWTLEVYQASNSLRLERHDFDAEAREAKAIALDRERAMAIAHGFLESVGETHAKADAGSITELEVVKATRGKPDGEPQVVGLQVSFRYAHEGLPLLGPGAKAQVTIGHDGELAQAYRFARDLRRVGERPTIGPKEAFDRFARSEPFENLGGRARVTVKSVQLGLLCLPPTETQGVLAPAYVLRGEVSTELQPRYDFVTYVAAAEIAEAEAKLHRWAHARPALLIA